MTPAVRNKYSGRSRDSQSGTKTKDSKSAVGRPCWRKKAWDAPPWSGAKCNRPSRSIRSSNRTTRWQSPHSPSKNSTGSGRAIDGFMTSVHIRRESGERKNKTPGIAGTTPPAIASRSDQSPRAELFHRAGDLLRPGFLALRARHRQHAILVGGADLVGLAVAIDADGPRDQAPVPSPPDVGTHCCTGQFGHAVCRPDWKISSRSRRLRLEIVRAPLLQA